MTDVAGTYWVQLEPRFETRYSSAQRKHVKVVVGHSIVATTKNRPDKTRAGCLLIKLRLHIPTSAFIAPVPEVSVVLPENDFEPVVSVTAEYPEVP